MTITERLQTEFPGITAMISGFVKVVRAHRAFNKALKDMEALKIKDPVNAWIWDVTQHSMLSYSDALSIYEYLSEFSTAFEQTPKEITEFVIKGANCGHTADMIKLNLEVLDRWARGKIIERRVPS
jgi:hypothetical protein